MLARVRANVWWLVQAAIATAVAWILAQQLFGHELRSSRPSQR